MEGKILFIFSVIRPWTESRAITNLERQAFFVFFLVDKAIFNSSLATYISGKLFSPINVKQIASVLPIKHKIEQRFALQYQNYEFSDNIVEVAV